MAAPRRSARAGRNGSKAEPNDSRDGLRLDMPAGDRRPLLDERGRAIITPNGFPLHF